MKKKFTIGCALLLLSVSFTSFAEIECGLGYVKRMTFYEKGPEQGVWRHKVIVYLDTDGIPQPNNIKAQEFAVFIGDSNQSAYKIEMFDFMLSSLNTAILNKSLVKAKGLGNYCTDTIFNMKIDFCSNYDACK